MLIEVVGGILSGSLALLADAGHMLTDAASIALALIAMLFAERPSSVQRTFGYHRLEILAALLNALALWLIAAWVLVEAYDRFTATLEVNGGLMLSIGVIGLGVNLGAAWILHGSSEHNVNVEGAFMHVIADLLGSVGVVISRYPDLDPGLDSCRPHSQCDHRNSYTCQQLAADEEGRSRAARGYSGTC